MKSEEEKRKKHQKRKKETNLNTLLYEKTNANRNSGILGGLSKSSINDIVKR